MNEQPPKPLWPHAPRLCNRWSLPSFPYIPGVSQKPESQHTSQIFEAARTPEGQQEIYFYGIDLYHQSFFYEAHEMWEFLWFKVGRESLEGKFLKALIQNAAALLKIELEELGPARRLSLKAFKLLKEVSDSFNRGKNFMGIDLSVLLKQFEIYYNSLWIFESDSPELPPKLSRPQALRFQITPFSWETQLGSG